MGLHPKPRDTDQFRTENPMDLAMRVIDDGYDDEPTNRVSNQLCEIADGIAVVESFSHMWSFATDDGLVCWDASGPQSGAAVTEALRGWSTDRVSNLVYTHGHVDHVGGSGALVADGRDRGHADPRVIGHENVTPRLERYDDTNGYNVTINARQFGGVSRRSGLGVDPVLRNFVGEDVVRPDTSYADSLDLSVGGLDMTMYHDKGETDDHTWTWVPEHKALLTGDLVVWVFPNAGNPQKVQRYPLEWAAGLRKMLALGPELLLPAHGLPIQGAERINRVLGDVATVLENLVRDTVDMMNTGAPLDEILHTVHVPADELAKPWLKPVYDEPEFVVRNIWRLYGGWWDGNAASLKPASEAARAVEMVTLAGGVDPMVARAHELATAGDFRLACHLVETAARAEPENLAVHGARAEIYQARRNAESSLMAKGIFAAAARESLQAAEDAEAS